MIKIETLDLIISEYYDEQMNPSNLLEYEARKANSRYINDYSNEICFEYFKITNSIKLTKIRLEQYSKKECDMFFNKTKKLFHTDSFFFKSRNKALSGSFLNISRNNSK